MIQTDDNTDSSNKVRTDYSGTSELRSRTALLKTLILIIRMSVFFGLRLHNIEDCIFRTYVKLTFNSYIRTYNHDKSPAIKNKSNVD